MGAEIYNGKILIDDLLIAYAEKVSISKEKSVKTTNTFAGTINTTGYTTGGTISIDSLIWPKNIEEAEKLEAKLNQGHIETIVITGTSYMVNGKPYKRTITGLHATLSSDDEEWSPEDGISSSIEFNVNTIKKENTTG